MELTEITIIAVFNLLLTATLAGVVLYEWKDKRDRHRLNDWINRNADQYFADMEQERKSDCHNWKKEGF
jgi:DTW domain-containing protein YfiP